MELVGVNPNSMTYASILFGMCQTSAFGTWNGDLQKMISSGCQYDIFAMTSLVDIYAHCASIGKSRELFDKCHPQIVISWNAMIGEYAMNGNGKEALNSLRK